MGHVLRSPHRLVSTALLALAGALGWAAGCHDLSGDCDLNLNCEDPDACTGVLAAGTCDECLQAACCSEAAVCKSDGDCLTCLASHAIDSAACQESATRTALAALTTCLDTRCKQACAALDTCNPVTNDGCSNGAGCDLGTETPPFNFTCYPPPFGAKLCEPCNPDSASGPFCDATLTCDFTTKTCARFCCTDADCGTGTCELDPQKAFDGALANMGDKVGICRSGGAPSCDAPAVAPSKGACLSGLAP
jgi:hypothetical protein